MTARWQGSFLRYIKSIDTLQNSRNSDKFGDLTITAILGVVSSFSCSLSSFSLALACTSVLDSSHSRLFTEPIARPFDSSLTFSAYAYDNFPRKIFARVCAGVTIRSEVQAPRSVGNTRKTSSLSISSVALWNFFYFSLLLLVINLILANSVLSCCFILTAAICRSIIALSRSS